MGRRHLAMNEVFWTLRQLAIGLTVLLVLLFSAGAKQTASAADTEAAEQPAAAAAEEPETSKPAGKSAPGNGQAAKAAKKFGDWALACPDPEDKEAAKGECRLVQSAVLNIEGKEGTEPHTQRVMLTAIGYAGTEKQPVLSVIVPLGVLIQPGLLLDVEGYDQLKLPLQRCDANGCLGFLLMKEQLVEAFRKGKDAQVTFFNIAGKGTKVRISLNGFSNGLEALGKRHKG